MTKGPIVIVEDDKDDQEVYADAIREMGIPNEFRFFDDGTEAFNYLLKTEEQPFIIISDINMPKMSGLEFKKKIQSDTYLSAKGIPFVFISTDASNTAVRHAHALSVQGYFQKPNSLVQFKEILRSIFTYWELCKHINNT
jgi:CheY-like chemotaxis protein